MLRILLGNPKKELLWSLWVHTIIMQTRPQDHNEDGLLGPNSIIEIFMDPVGNLFFVDTPVPPASLPKT